MPAAFTSESRVVKVVFGSDEDVTDTGFTASFTQIDGMQMIFSYGQSHKSGYFPYFFNCIRREINAF